MRNWLKIVENLENDPIDRFIKRGEFNDYEIETATCGLCGTFALALYRFLKKKNIPSQLVLFSEYDDPDEFENVLTPEDNIEPGFRWRHVAAKVGENYYDVRGRVDPETVHDEFGTTQIVPLSEHRLVAELKLLNNINRKDNWPNSAYSNSHYRNWKSRLRETKLDFLPPTPKNINLAREFVLKKWKERAAERFEPEPVDLSRSCKFSSMFAQRIFGGKINGHWQHQYLKLKNGTIIDLNIDAEDVKRLGRDAHNHDSLFFRNNSEYNSAIKSNQPRIDAWVKEFYSILDKHHLNETQENTIKLYHLTNDPKFTLDHEYEPIDNSISIEDRSGRKGIYLAKNVEPWVNGYGYVRPFVAEISAEPSVAEFKGRWGGEIFVPASHFNKLKVDRVIPLDAICREEFGQHGWIEQRVGKEFDTGGTITTPDWETPFRNYTYNGDTRQLPTKETNRLKRFFDIGYKKW